MNDDNIPISRRLRNAASGSAAEHVLNVLKAGLATAPFCGGIASLMTDYIPSTKLKRLEEFAQMLAADMAALQDQVDQAVFESDEYAFLFEKCFRGVAENYQTEKLSAFRAVLVNSATGASFSNDEKEYFLNLVSTLSVLHLRILWFMHAPEEYLARHNIPAEQITGSYSDFMPRAIPGVGLETIKSAFGDLHQYGLTNSDKSLFNSMTVSHGLALLGGRVSGHGKAFVAFCSSPLE